MTSKTENDAKSLARLAAVQGLYRIEMTQHAAKDVIKDFHADPASFMQDTPQSEGAAKADKELFGQIVTGVTKDSATLDEMIAGALDAKVSAGRIEILLRATLRAGAWELYNHSSIAAGVIINDYVDVTNVFFSGREPGLVNAVLDKLGKNLRSR